MAKLTKPSSAAEFRRLRQDWEEGFLFEFPSGMVAQLRPIDVADFIGMDRIPDALTPLIVAQAERKGTKDPSPDEVLRQDIELVAIFAKRAFVSPRVVDEITDPENEITVADLLPEDRIALTGLLNMPASVLRRFRTEQAGDVEAVDGLSGDAPAAIENDGSAALDEA